MFREILTKAVVGKGRKSSITIHEILPEKAASRTLGCWIINSHATPYVKSDETIEVEGTYDIHIWYGCGEDQDTEIIKRTIDYKELIPFKIKPGERLGMNNDLKAFFVKYPVCTGLKLLENGKIEVVVEKELVVDAVGETKLKVQVTQGEEEWILDGEIEASIDPDYVIKDSHQPTIL